MSTRVPYSHLIDDVPVDDLGGAHEAVEEVVLREVHIGLQPLPHRVAASATYGCTLAHYYAVTAERIRSVLREAVRVRVRVRVRIRVRSVLREVRRKLGHAPAAAADEPQRRTWGTWGCSLKHIGLQAGYTGLQPPARKVAVAAPHPRIRRGTSLWKRRRCAHRREWPAARAASRPPGRWWGDGGRWWGMVGDGGEVVGGGGR